MKGMHYGWEKENTIYKTEDYKGGYLQMYFEEGYFVVEMNIKDGACKKFTDKKEAEEYYSYLFDKYNW